MTSSSQDRDYLTPLHNLPPVFIELTEGTDGYITPNTKIDDAVLPPDRDGYIKPTANRDGNVLPTVTDGYIEPTAKRDVNVIPTVTDGYIEPTAKRDAHVVPIVTDGYIEPTANRDGNVLPTVTDGYIEPTANRDGNVLPTVTDGYIEPTAKRDVNVIPTVTDGYIEPTAKRDAHVVPIVTDGYIEPTDKRDANVVPTVTDGYIEPTAKRDDNVLPTDGDEHVEPNAKKDQTADTKEYRYMSLDGRESGIYDEPKEESYLEPSAHKQQPRRKLPTPDEQGILKTDTPTGPRDYTDARSADPSPAHISGDPYYNRSRERPIVEGNYTQTRSDDRFEGEYSYQDLSRSGRSDSHVYSGVTNNRYRPTDEPPEYSSIVPQTLQRPTGPHEVSYPIIQQPSGSNIKTQPVSTEVTKPGCICTCGAFTVSICSIFLCCPFGIGALVLAVMANAHSNEEKYKSARYYYRASCIVGWLGIIICVAIVVTVVNLLLNSINRATDQNSF